MGKRQLIFLQCDPDLHRLIRIRNIPGILQQLHHPASRLIHVAAVADPRHVLHDLRRNSRLIYFVNVLKY